MKLVTIVTPSYNQAPFLERTIRSVLGQTYPNIEYFVMDGGSTDGSVEIIQRYEKKLAGWVSEKDRGQTDAINKGFARANGEIIAWLNSDDTYEPDAVAQAVAYLQEHPDVGLVYADSMFINAEDEVIGQFPSRQTDYRRLRRGYVHVSQQAAFFRTEHWRQVGPLDPTFYFAMDYDLWVRLAQVSQIAYIPGHWANFRLHGGAKTIAADDRCWPEMLRVHYRDGGSFFSVIVLKYYIRLLAGPLLRLKRRMQIRA